MEAKQLDPNWKDRERERQDSRTMPVWKYAAFWRERSYALSLHYAHVSTVDPTMIAFTADEDKGQRDIQTRMKPGRYLTRYFSDVLTEKQIKALVDWWATGRCASSYDDEKRYPLAFASDPDDIVDVYKLGPDSCMSGAKWSDDMHPVQVYGAGDLAIAYVTDKETDKVISRALVWAEHKVFGRVYPTPVCYMRDGYTTPREAEEVQTALANRLRALGYRADASGDFSGARLLKREHKDGGHIMPYLDGSYGVRDAGNVWRMSYRNADFNCQETEGRIRGHRPPYATCGRCCDEIEDEAGCNLVFEMVGDGGGRAAMTWCAYCEEYYSFRCTGFDESFSEDSVDSVEVNGRTYTQYYADNNFRVSDHSGDWFDPDDTDFVEVDGETWTRDEFDDAGGFDCAVTGDATLPQDRDPDYPVSINAPDYDVNAWLAAHVFPELPPLLALMEAA